MMTFNNSMLFLSCLLKKVCTLKSLRSHWEIVSSNPGDVTWLNVPAAELAIVCYPFAVTLKHDTRTISRKNYTSIIWLFGLYWDSLSVSYFYNTPPPLQQN